MGSTHVILLSSGLNHEGGGGGGGGQGGDSSTKCPVCVGCLKMYP